MDHETHDDGLRIGPAAGDSGHSPRMLRYLEEQGVLRPDRGPDGRGHRHFPPPEIAIAEAARRATDAGHATVTLARIRANAERQVERILADGDPLAWFEALAQARAVERHWHPRPPRRDHEPPDHGPHARR
jgi:DNA-binding transcriptional MerR regulator